VTTEQPATTTVANEILTTTTTAAPTTPEPTKPPRLSGKERESLISHLGNVDLTNVDKLVLTPTQRLAIAQELEYQELGLAPFTDPTPWQRLTREQQTEFNEKYLALRSDLQEYSRNQFLSLQEDKQAHAYRAFLSLDKETLSRVIERELKEEQEDIIQIKKLIEEREIQKLEQVQTQKENQGPGQQYLAQQQRQLFKERPRSQLEYHLKNSNFDQIEARNQKIKRNKMRQNYDPRRRQQHIQQQERQFERRPQQISKFQEKLTSAERIHFKRADRKLLESIRLQGCISKPSTCK